MQGLRGRGASLTLGITLHGCGEWWEGPRPERSAGQGDKALSAVREFELPPECRGEAPGDVKWSADATKWISQWLPQLPGGSQHVGALRLKPRGTSLDVALLGEQGGWLEQQCQPKSRVWQTWYSESRLAGPGPKSLGKVAVGESRRGTG